MDTPVRKFFNVVGPAIFVAIGTGIGFAIYSMGDTAKFDSKINMLYQNDLQWGYLSSFLFCYLVQHLNSYPMQYKARIMRGKSGQMRSNMFIYKNAAEGSPQSRIVLSTEGDEAFYNRANRSLYHFMENSLSMVLAIILDSVVFPIPTFVLTIFFFIGRIIYTSGYTSGGYGKHAPGFIIVAIAQNTLVGLLLIAGLKGLTGTSSNGPSYQ